jgi:hypothetical protein
MEAYKKWFIVILHVSVVLSVDPWRQRNYDPQQTSQIYSDVDGVQSYPYVSWRQGTFWEYQITPDNDQIIISSQGYGYYLSQVNDE